MKHAAVAVACLFACTKDTSRSPAPPPEVTFGDTVLPAVAPNGYAEVPVKMHGPLVVVSPKVIVVEGKALLAITDGDVSPDEKEGGALGLEIPRLALFMQRYVEQAGPQKHIYLAFDRTLSYRLLIEVAFTLKKAEIGVTSFELLATTPTTHPPTALGPVIVKDAGTLVSTSIVLPNKVPPNYVDPEHPVRMIVSAPGTETYVWSISQVEGSMRSPKATIVTKGADRTKALGDTLTEIVKRRWASTAARPEADRAVILQASSGTPMQEVAELIGAVRSAPDGTPLFSEVHLSAGFE